MDHNFLTVLLVFSLAIISPGPNFILVVNRALTVSRQSAVYTAFGVAVGSGLFAFAGMLGLILLINSLPYFSVLIRLLGGGYLLYLGLSMVWSGIRRAGLTATDMPKAKVAQRPATAFLSGLTTNLTNPKAWAFYFSLFTLVVDPATPVRLKMVLVLIMFLISFSWYATMAVLVSDRRVQQRFLSFQPVIRSVLGSLLAFIGGRMLLRY